MLRPYDVCRLLSFRALTADEGSGFFARLWRTQNDSACRGASSSRSVPCLSVLHSP